MVLLLVHIPKVLPLLLKSKLFISRPGRYHQNTYHENFTKLSRYWYYHDNSKGYKTCTKKAWLRQVSASRHTLQYLWFYYWYLHVYMYCTSVRMNTVITIKLSYRNISKYQTYHPGLFISMETPTPHPHVDNGTTI